ncbi:hypothetical protein D3C76_1024190 [compost metagenome]
MLSGDFVQPRNYKFLQKTMCLFQYCFEHFSEVMEGAELEYKGMKAAPSFDRFRHDLTILAGHYEATFDIMGNLKLEAKSLSYGKCSEQEAEKIYSDVINAALKQVFKKSMSEQELNKIVETILGYA